MRKKMMSVLLALAMVLTLLPATALAEGSVKNLGDASSWITDRTEPNGFTIENGVISFSVNEQPGQDSWYGWQGRKAYTDQLVSNYWKVSYTMDVTETMLSEENVNASLWIQVDNANGNAASQSNCVDWAIIQFIHTGDVAKWQSWDANGEGGWKEIAGIPAQLGTYTIDVEFFNGTLTQYINGQKANSYTLSDKATAPASLIAQGRSYGESFDVRIGVPTVTTALNTIAVSTAEELYAAANAAQSGATITLLQNVELDATGLGNTQGALTLNKNVILDGAGKTLSVKDGTFTVSGTSGPSMINVENDATVTLRNLTIDGENVAKHGINAYGGTVVLENVTVMNNRWYGVVCNGTQMTVTNLTTQGNQWGINVENRSGQGSNLTIQSAAISEEASIVVEKGKTEYTDSTVVINGGSFRNVGVAEGAEATRLTITGGTYAMDVSAYIPSGYVCTNSGNGFYTVSLYVPPYIPPVNGGSNGGSNTVTNPDGSTTTTVTKPDGTVTVTDKDTQGNVTETVSKPDGTSTTTVTTTNGSSSVTTMGQTGKVEAQVNLSQSAVNAADNEAVALPMASLPVTDSQAMAPVVTVDLPTGTAAAKVEVPVQNVTAGTVAILVKADGSQEIVKTSVTTESGVVLTVEDGAKVMIVDNSKDFADVPASYWGSDAVDFATSRDLFNGTSATTFDPDADMNRAMIVTVLARLEGVDTTTGSTWYEAGQQWAIEAGISDGSDLNSAVSREQLVTMLYRYAGSPAVSGVISGYADTDSVSSWAVEAMTWAINEGIINGVGNSLDPQGDATRAQVATILMRFVATL